MLDIKESSVRVNAVVDIGTWHNRMGLASYSRLDLIADNLGTMKQKNKGNSYCHICHNSNFEILHNYFWGPLSVETVDVYKYFFDYSG